MKIKKVIKLGIGAVFLFLASIMIADKIVSNKTEKYVYDEVSKIPKNRVGLVLGASKKLKNGNDNLYFVFRIQAAKQLYQSGKVTLFVVSGDNSRKDYNEAQDMKDDLVKAGVPEDSIYLDYAGLRTLDSVVRMKTIFGQEKFTIISQKFHNERAVLIAQHFGLETVGYDAKDVTAYSGFKTRVREKLARVKVFLDFLTGKQAKYLGDKIKIG